MNQRKWDQLITDHLYHGKTIGQLSVKYGVSKAEIANEINKANNQIADSLPATTNKLSPIKSSIDKTISQLNDNLTTAAVNGAIVANKLSDYANKYVDMLASEPMMEERIRLLRIVKELNKMVNEAAKMSIDLLDRHNVAPGNQVEPKPVTDEIERSINDKILRLLNE